MKACKTPAALLSLFASAVLLGLTAPLPAVAQEPPGEEKKTTVAVMDLSMSGGIPEVYQETLSDRLRLEMHNTGAFNVVERKAMEDILAEQGLQMSGCTSNECAVQIGRMLGVEAIVAGSIGRVGNAHSIILRMIDVEKGLIIKSKNVDCSCPIEEVMSTRLRQAAQLLAEQKPSASPEEISMERSEPVSKEKVDRGHPLPRSLFWPGWGQIATGRTTMGVIYTVAEVGALGVLGVSIADYQRALADYEDSRDRYESATTAQDAANFYQDKIDRYEDAERTYDDVMLFSAVAGGIYLMNVLDAAIFGPADAKVEKEDYIGDAGSDFRWAVAPSVDREGTPMLGVRMTLPTTLLGGR